MTVIPQILTNQAEDFLSLTKELREYGIRIEHRDVHRQEHFSNCRDLADEERQDQADRKEHAGKGYFFYFFHLEIPPLCFLLESVYHSSTL